MRAHPAAAAELEKKPDASIIIIIIPIAVVVLFYFIFSHANVLPADCSGRERGGEGYTDDFPKSGTSCGGAVKMLSETVSACQPRLHAVHSMCITPPPRQ